ncbi:hypothetical protein [Brevibacillus formosus]
MHGIRVWRNHWYRHNRSALLEADHRPLDIKETVQAELEMFEQQQLIAP